MTRVALLRILRAKCAVLVALVAFLAPALAGSLGTLCIAPEHLGVARHGGCCCETRGATPSPVEAPSRSDGPAVAEATCGDPCCSEPAHCPCIDVPAAKGPVASLERRAEPLPSRTLVAVLVEGTFTPWRAGLRVPTAPLPPPEVRVIPPPRSAVLRC